jgi:hypothetical protein
MLACCGIRLEGNQYVNAGRDDNQRDDDGERARVHERGDGGTEKTTDERGGAHRSGNTPVDRAAALVEPGTEDAGEEEAEERSGSRLVNAEARKQSQIGNHKHPADTDSADQQADECTDRRKQKI